MNVMENFRNDNNFSSACYETTSSKETDMSTAVTHARFIFGRSEIEETFLCQLKVTSKERESFQSRVFTWIAQR